jgi:hypothetical protein
MSGGAEPSEGGSLPPLSYRELAMAIYDLADRCEDAALLADFINLAGRCLRRGMESGEGST